MQTKEAKVFSITPGQLVRIKRYSFGLNGKLNITKEYAIVRRSFSCAWETVSNTLFNNLEIIIKHDITARTRPFDIEFIEDMPKKEQNKIIFDILLSI